MEFGSWDNHWLDLFVLGAHEHISFERNINNWLTWEHHFCYCIFNLSSCNIELKLQGSSLPLCSPCRGIYALTRALLDVDLRIKHGGEDESADEKFVSGYFELMVNCNYDMRFRQRLHDGIRSHILDVDGRYIGWSIAATVIASVDVPYSCQVSFTAYTSGFDDEVTIFKGTYCEAETVEFRHVVAVKVLWTLELCLKLDGVRYSHSFKAGVDSKPVKFGPVKALVVWSIMNRHRFWW